MDPMTIKVILYFLTWLLSYYASRKAGLSSSAAALVATGATAAFAYSKYDDKIVGALTDSDAIKSSGPLSKKPTSSGNGFLDFIGKNSSAITGGLVAGIGGSVAAKTLKDFPSWLWWTLGAAGLYVVIK